LGDHDLTYRGYISNGRSENQKPEKFSDMGFGGNLALHLEMLDGINFGLSGYTGTIRETRPEMAIDINLEPGEITPLFADPASIENNLALLIGSKLSSPSLSNITYDYGVTTEEREYSMGADFSIEKSNLKLQGEFNLKYNVDERTDEEIGDDTQLGFYGLLSYKVPIGQNANLTPYFMYEEIQFEEKNDKSIPTKKFQGFITGLNLNLFRNFYLKTEYNYIILPPIQTSPIPNDYEDGDLDIQVFSTQVSVAF
jgi:hypothetical protein